MLIKDTLHSSTGKNLYNEKSFYVDRSMDCFSISGSQLKSSTNAILNKIVFLLQIIYHTDYKPTRKTFSKPILVMSSKNKLSNEGTLKELCKTYFFPLLHYVLIKCWKENDVPENKQKINIIGMHKNKKLQVQFQQLQRIIVS